ncbi:hypothetical protein DMENIID0001_020750 [Sergentomyia squamirostris]
MDWSKGEVFLTLLYFMTAVGILQMLIKSYISTYCHHHYMTMVNWMRREYNEIEVKGTIMREIIEKNIHLAFNQSRTIVMLYVIVFLLAPLGYMITVIIRDGLHAVIIIPYVPYDHPHAKLIYYSVELPYTFLAGFLSGIGDSTTIISGIHVMKAIDTVNELIALLDDKEKANQCPNLLIHIHKKHAEIIRILFTLNEIIYIISLVQLFTSTSMFLVLFTSAKTQPFEIVFYIFMLCVVSQLLLLCAFGEMIFSKTQNIFTKLYLTRWYDMSLANQKIILMMMRMSEAPYGLKAGGMYDLNLYTFIQIVKMAISYCAIIITLT